MADREWVGTTADWNTAANWLPAAVPLDGENVFFTGAVQQSVDGVALAGAGDALGDINIHEAYRGNIGTPGSKVTGVSCDNLRFAGRGGKINFSFSTGITNLVLQASRGITDFGEIAGVITNLIAQGCSGSFTITAGAALTNVDIHNSPQFTLNIGASVTTLGDFRVTSGRVVNESSVAVAGGSLFVFGNAIFEHKTGTITMVELANGGTLIHTSAGTVIDVILYPGGLFDGRQNAELAIAITTATLHGGTLALGTGLNNYTVSTLAKFGGSYIPEKGQS